MVYGYSVICVAKWQINWGCQVGESRNYCFMQDFKIGITFYPVGNWKFVYLNIFLWLGVSLKVFAGVYYILYSLIQLFK